MVASLGEQIAQWGPFELWVGGLKRGRKRIELAELISDLESSARGVGSPPYEPIACGPLASEPNRGFVRVVAGRIQLPESPPQVDLRPWLSSSMWVLSGARARSCFKGGPLCHASLRLPAQVLFFQAGVQ